MSSFSNISIVGNLTRDPEMFVFEKSGRKKTTMTVAVNNWSKNKNDQLEKTADFYKVETWDRLADLTKDYLRKGSQVAVSGRLQMENWRDKEGKDRVTPVVKASQVALPQKGTAKPPEAAANSRTEEAIDRQIRAAIIKEDDEYDVTEIPPEVLASDGECSSSTDSNSTADDDGSVEISEDAETQVSGESSASDDEVPNLSSPFGQTMKVVDPSTTTTVVAVAESGIKNPPTIESIARTA